MSTTDRPTTRANPRTQIKTIGSRLVLGMIALATVAAVACGSEESPPIQQSGSIGATSAPGSTAEPAGSEPRHQGLPRQSQGVSSTGTSETPTTEPAGDQPSAQSTPAGNQSTAQSAPAATPTGSEASEKTASSPEDAREAESMLEVAGYHMENRRFHQAAHVLDQAIAANPSLTEAHNLRGLSRSMTGDHEAAIQDLTLVLQNEDADHGRAYAYRSFVHSRMGNYDEALADAEQALHTLNFDNQFAEADARFALFTAQFRSGHYGSTIPQKPRFDHSAGPVYGIAALYQHGQIQGNLEVLKETSATLILQPDDIRALSERARAYTLLYWHAMAAEDYTRIIEADAEGRHDWAHTSRAGQWAAAGQHDQIANNPQGLDPSKDAEAGVLLATAYWRQGDIQKATQTIDAMDYGDWTAYFPDQDPPVGYPNQLNTNDQGAFAAHLALKGALLAAQGQLDEGLKYLYQPQCQAKAERSPTNTGPFGTDYRGAVRDMGQAWLHAKKANQEWRQRPDALAAWQWCTYPKELIDNPEAGLLTALMTTNQQDWSFPGLPNRHNYRASAAQLDPIVITSQNPELLHYMAAWTILGLDRSGTIDAMREINRAIELGNNHPDAHRLKADIHISWATSLPKHIVQTAEREEIPAWRTQNYELAIESYAKYESLVSPQEWQASYYHFTRGQALGKMNRNQDAQAAFQQAHQLGYDETAVKDALIELNQ